MGRLSSPKAARCFFVYLVEILLPLSDEHRDPFPSSLFDEIADRLTRMYGGVTSFIRSPAEGRWHDAGQTEHDEIVVVEVMIQDLDRAWWKSFRKELERQFRQDEIVIRCHGIEKL